MTVGNTFDGYLRQFEEDPGRLDELAAEDSEIGFRFLVETVETGRRGIETFGREQNILERDHDAPVLLGNFGG